MALFNRATGSEVFMKFPTLAKLIYKISGNRMQVIFTNIDEKDPEMMFYFFLQIQGTNRKYVGKL